MKKKFLYLLMVMAITIFQFAPTMVNALSYELNDGDIINSYNVTSDVVTLYVGNISVDGTSTLKYLYTDKSVNTETLTEMRKILTSDYASLLPTTAGQVAVSNDSSVTVNDVFTDARMVAINKYPSGTVSDTSSTILYNQTQFNSLATASQTEISDEKTAETNNLSAWNTRKTEWDAVQQAKVDEDPSYTPVSFPEEYVKAFNDTTSYPTDSYFIADNKGTESRGYIIRNGVVTQVNTYPLNRTIIKVVNTSANVTTPKCTVTFNSNGGSDVASQIVSKGQRASEPTDPTKDGYMFMGWYFDSALQNPYYFGMPVSNDITLYAKWISNDKVIDNINITVVPPEVGKEVKSVTLHNDEYNYDYPGQSINPSVTIDNDSVEIGGAFYTTGYPVDGLEPDMFYGTFEDGQYYYAMIDIYLNDDAMEEGYVLAKNLKVKVNGTDEYVLSNYYGMGYTRAIFTKVLTGSDTYSYIEGAGQTYKPGDDGATFRINADYSLFENGGKVYVDDKLVDSSNYTSKSGSTIITFTKTYMSSLGNGTHTLKVVFNNGGVATTTFKVEGSNPNTSDPVNIYVILWAISLGVITFVVINNKKYNKVSNK